MELLLKRNETQTTFSDRYDLFVKLELNPEELALINKATPNKTILLEDDFKRNTSRWRLSLIPAGFVGIIVGMFATIFINPLLFLPVAIVTCIVIQQLFFNQMTGNVTVGDIITGRTIHCKSLDELLVKEEDIREKITRYCNNLGALHALGNEQRIKLN